MCLQQILLLVLLVCQVQAEDDFDTSQLVVDVSFSTKKNKEITELSQDEKDNFVQIHNAYRSLVRPYSADMIEVTWDDDIAAFAQEWANQCTATHRTDRDLDPWINMGENLYWLYGGRYHEGQAVKYWWDEVQYYTMSTQVCQSGEVCGHYITMVWGKTEKIGCGVARCDRLWDHPDYGRGAYYFVCNYSGRFISDIKPYTATDIPCSACYTTGYSKCRNNFCVTNDVLVSGEGYDGTTDMVGLSRSLSYTSDPDADDTVTTYMTSPTALESTLMTTNSTSYYTSTPTSQEPTKTTQKLKTTTEGKPTTTKAPTVSTHEPTPTHTTLISRKPTTSTIEPTTITTTPTPKGPTITTADEELVITSEGPTSKKQTTATITQERTTTTKEQTTKTQELDVSQKISTTNREPPSTDGPTTTYPRTTITPQEKNEIIASPSPPKTSKAFASTQATTKLVHRATTDGKKSPIDEIDEYCRSRNIFAVRKLCWRLNNIMRRVLGVPSAKNFGRRDFHENRFALEGGSVDLNL